jgi:hypothetical protein
MLETCFERATKRMEISVKAIGQEVKKILLIGLEIDVLTPSIRRAAAC